ncbi:hypothetical protein [Aliagarivorans taiwanensis]|uniref:hypothetical protein n=1 Tax=Aliagarivorans taiwanensis TaxID=561966 RepID=UPI0012FC01F5|nr:hypothetical protein [Aliagarivorans taiwanensis]
MDYTMYFAKYLVKGRQYYHGPFFMSPKELLTIREQAVEANDSKALKRLKYVDFTVLDNASEFCSLEDGLLMEPNSQLDVRQSLSCAEYNNVYLSFSGSYEQLADWLHMIGLPASRHRNFMSGAGCGSNLVRAFSDLQIAHSHMMEISAFALAPYTIKGIPVAKMTEAEFAASASQLYLVLVNSSHLAMRYYWGQRSVNEICQLYIYVQTLEHRQVRNLIASSAKSSLEALTKLHLLSEQAKVVGKKISANQPITHATMNRLKALSGTQLGLLNGDARTTEDAIREMVWMMITQADQADPTALVQQGINGALSLEKAASLLADMLPELDIDALLAAQRACEPSEAKPQQSNHEAGHQQSHGVFDQALPASSPTFNACDEFGSEFGSDGDEQLNLDQL